MSTGKSDTSSKRKKSTPQKFKNRKLFAASTNDLLEQPEYSRARDVEDQENQMDLKLPVTMQNKENLPEECPNGSVTVSRGRGRPKGSKNKTFSPSSSRAYDVREAKSPDSANDSNGEDGPHNGEPTPHRRRGRPKGSTKVKVKIEGDSGPKRARGRPKGSKNKKPSKAALLQRLSSGQKIGRGRPRKIPLPFSPVSDGLTPKRGRGRPRGSVNKLPSAPRVKLSLGSAPREGKRKRGRPCKILLHPTIMSLTPKRPRGRPRIKAIYHDPDNELLLSGGSEIKKKRGRPSKMGLHPTLISLKPKRPRGRPRIKPLLPVLPKAVDELSLLTGTNEVKRKRGRPRKSESHTELSPLTPKRPRGRPRIKDLTQELPEPVHELKTESESNTEEEDNSEDSEEEFEEK